jgi:hypothetical protein
VAAGDSCELEFGERGGDAAGQEISFGGSVPITSTTTTTTPTPTTILTTATTAPTQTTTSPTVRAAATPIAEPTQNATLVDTTKTVVPAGSLAFTGAGRSLWLTGILGILLLDLGFLLLVMYYRPRELLQLTVRGISRIFGGE